MELSVLKEKLKQGVYEAHKNGARIHPAHVGGSDENGNLIASETFAVCLLVANVLGQPYDGNYIEQVAYKFNISFQQADDIENGFMTIGIRTKSEYYKIGEEIYYELLAEGIISQRY